MARRVLSARLYPSLLLALGLCHCRHEDRTPAPSASASAAGDDFTRNAREQHFEQELARASARWQSQPSLGDCAAALKEKADLALCQAATSALRAVTAEPAATPELALARLAPGALALVRLTERVRYLSLAELADRRVERDAGVTPATSATGAAVGATRAQPAPRKDQRGPHAEKRALELSEGPLSQLLPVTIRFERDLIRNIGAYLEYGPLPVRRAAFDTVKQLYATHPRWPALDHLLREAFVLETDAELKRALRESSPSSAPQGGRAGQSAETK